MFFFKASFFFQKILNYNFISVPVTNIPSSNRVSGNIKGWGMGICSANWMSLAYGTDLTHS